MSIFDVFSSKDELMQALESAIKSNKNGEDGTETFFVENEFGDVQAKLDAEIKQSQSQRRRAQEAEAKLKEQEKEIAKLAATNETFSKLNPEKQKETIDSLVRENGALKAEKAELESQLEPFRQRISEYERKETRQTIEAELNNAAAELGIRAEAMRDVRLRANQLTINDIGMVATPDGVLVKDYLKSELEQSPHWLPPSQGGGSAPGVGTGKLDNAVLYEQAKAKKDIAGMISTAKPFDGVRLGGTETK